VRSGNKIGGCTLSQKIVPPQKMAVAKVRTVPCNLRAQGKPPQEEQGGTNSLGKDYPNCVANGETDVTREYEKIATRGDTGLLVSSKRCLARVGAQPGPKNKESPIFAWSAWIKNSLPFSKKTTQLKNKDIGGQTQ